MSLHIHLGNFWQPFVGLAIATLESGGQSLEASTDAKKKFIGKSLEKIGEELQAVLDFANGKSDTLPHVDTTTAPTA